MRYRDNDYVSGLPNFCQVDTNRSGVLTASSYVSDKQIYGTGVHDPIKDIKLHIPIYLNIR